ncbi:DUF1449 domain-containing protein [Pseudomaricurvus alkylphenolicus]|nr:DUF1449 domain-containing protein [Pseudomaricurvus alkylphenolicus]
MDPFYQNITSFPTAFFSFFLALSVLYWLVAVLGFVDLEVLDFDLPEGDSGPAGQGSEGVSNPDVLAGLMLRFGLVGVPVTVIISLISLIGWVICYYSVHFLLAWMGEGFLRLVFGLPVLLVSLYIAVMLTAQVIKPLRPLFLKATQETEKKVLGQVAVVRTSRVDKDFGEASLEDGGAGLILKIRATGEQTFTRGDRVVLLEYLKEQNVYRVVSEAEYKGA